MNTEFDKTQTIAIAKLVSKGAYETASEGVKAGSYNVDFMLHVTGTVKKGEDYDQKFVAKADPWMLLAVALSKLNGVTVASIVKEAETAKNDMIDSIKAEASEAINQIKANVPDTKANGKITAKLSMSIA